MSAVILLILGRKKEITYKENRMKEIGAHVGYIILWGRDANKVVLTGVHVCYYTAAPPRHVRAVLSGTRAVRDLCGGVVVPC